MSTPGNPTPHAKNAPDGAVYPLRTLQDIFNLPSFEHMERCLGELTKVMLQARATADLFVGLAEARGVVVSDQKFGWPESLPWKDDGKGEIASTFQGAHGEPLVEVRLAKGPPNPGPSR